MSCQCWGQLSPHGTAGGCKAAAERDRAQISDRRHRTVGRSLPARHVCRRGDREVSVHGQAANTLQSCRSCAAAAADSRHRLLPLPTAERHRPRASHTLAALAAPVTSPQPSQPARISVCSRALSRPTGAPHPPLRYLSKHCQDNSFPP